MSLTRRKRSRDVVCDVPPCTEGVWQSQGQQRGTRACHVRASDGMQCSAMANAATNIATAYSTLYSEYAGLSDDTPATMCGAGSSSSSSGGDDGAWACDTTHIQPAVTTMTSTAVASSPSPSHLLLFDDSASAAVVDVDSGDNTNNNNNNSNSGSSCSSRVVDEWRRRDEVVCATAVYLADAHAQMRTCASLRALCVHLCDVGWRQVWAALHHSDGAQAAFVRCLVGSSSNNNNNGDDDKEAAAAMLHGSLCVLSLLLLRARDDGVDVDDAVDACARHGVVDWLLAALVDGDDHNGSGSSSSSSNEAHTSSSSSLQQQTPPQCPRRRHWSECVTTTTTTTRPTTSRTTATAVTALRTALSALCGEAMAQSTSSPLLALRLLHCLTLAQRDRRCTRASYTPRAHHVNSNNNSDNSNNNNSSSAHAEQADDDDEASCHVPAVLLTRQGVMATVLRACSTRSATTTTLLPHALSLLEALTSCVMLRVLACDEQQQHLSLSSSSSPSPLLVPSHTTHTYSSSSTTTTTPVTHTLVHMVQWLLSHCLTRTTTTHVTSALRVLTNITDATPWVVSCVAHEQQQQQQCRGCGRCASHVCCVSCRLAQCLAVLLCRGAQRECAVVAHKASSSGSDNDDNDDGDAVTLAVCCAVNVVEWELRLTPCDGGRGEDAVTRTSSSSCFAQALVHGAEVYERANSNGSTDEDHHHNSSSTQSDGRRSHALCHRLSAAVYAAYTSHDTARMVRSGYYALLLAALSLTSTTSAHDDNNSTSSRSTCTRTRSMRDVVAAALRHAGAATSLGAQTAHQPLRALVAVLQEFVLFVSESHMLTQPMLLGTQRILDAVMRANDIDVTAT